MNIASDVRKEIKAQGRFLTVLLLPGAFLLAIPRGFTAASARHLFVSFPLSVSPRADLFKRGASRSMLLPVARLY
jgi:hypothetical protein